MAEDKANRIFQSFSGSALQLVKQKSTKTILQGALTHTLTRHLVCVIKWRKKKIQL